MTDRAIQTRDALLDAAEELFSECGYAAVGTREIADRAGANLASIRYHFGSKRELYLETVRRAMGRAEQDSSWAALSAIPEDVEAAAVQLTRFINGYLHRLLTTDTPQPCGMLMHWEAVRPSEAIDAVVHDYIKPSHDHLVALVGKLLGEGNEQDARLCARSILAQVLHYKMFGAFIERLEAEDERAKTTIEQAAEHIVRFSLRAMGLDDAFIDRVLRMARQTEQSTVPAGLVKEEDGGK